MNAYNLSKELIEIMGDIDRKLEQKGKTSMFNKWLMIDADTTRLETRMFELIDKLKGIEIPESK